MALPDRIIFIIIIMPGDEETRLRKELADQIEESQKWFDKVRRINEVVTSTKHRKVWRGGSKQPGVMGATPSPGQSNISGMSPSDALMAIERILRA